MLKSNGSSTSLEAGWDSSASRSARPFFLKRVGVLENGRLERVDVVVRGWRGEVRGLYEVVLGWKPLRGVGGTYRNDRSI